MRMLEKLARMVGVRDDQVEDALGHEARARDAVRLSRRGFFAAGAVMAATPLVPTKAYSFLFAPRATGWNYPFLLTGLSIVGSVEDLKRIADWYLLPAIFRVEDGGVSHGNRLFPMDPPPQEEGNALFAEWSDPEKL